MLIYSSRSTPSSKPILSTVSSTTTTTTTKRPKFPEISSNNNETIQASAKKSSSKQLAGNIIFVSLAILGAFLFWVPFPQFSSSWKLSDTVTECNKYLKQGQIWRRKMAFLIGLSAQYPSFFEYWLSLSFNHLNMLTFEFERSWLSIVLKLFLLKINFWLLSRPFINYVSDDGSW